MINDNTKHDQKQNQKGLFICKIPSWLETIILDTKANILQMLWQEQWIAQTKYHWSQEGASSPLNIFDNALGSVCGQLGLSLGELQSLIILFVP